MVSVYKKFSGGHFSAYSLLATNLIVSLMYCLFEWLFIVTKPSFMSLLPFSDKALILGYGGFLLAALTTVPLLMLIFTDHLIHRKRSSCGLIKAGFILPILTATLMVFLLVDNFTYTVFKFGIISTAGLYRGIYILVLGVTAFAVTGEILRLGAWIERKMGEGPARRKNTLIFSAILMGVFLISLVVPLRQGVVNHSDLGLNGDLQAKEDSPNILLFTIDSLDATHMSVYGYERATTPFLEELSQSSLVAQNAFTNAQGTVGSITSILTGKDPMDTHVLLADDILRSEDSYQHLPGILKSHGYHTVQLSFSSYADAVDINFLNAFDVANGRIDNSQGTFKFITRALPSNNAYFFYEIGSRLTDRLKHVFFIEEMENPYKQVTKPKEKFNDQEKMDTLVSLIKEENQPVFVHFHWMGIHGPMFYPQNQQFSAGKDLKTQEKYDMDLYDDSILEMDQALQSLYSHLEAEAAAERDTILVIAADHSLKWAKVRLPLIVHFPDGENAKVIQENAQNLDIAPTLLDYLDIDQPEWMIGQSLLKELKADRSIFTTRISSTKKEEKEGKIQIDDSFYPFGRVSVLVCDTWYEIRLPTAENWLGRISDYAGTCEVEKLTGEQGYELIINHLQVHGFDTATLEERIIIR